MILSCNSCEKKFVVPDDAIGKSGRLVQCSSCGNKWKQFPIKTDIKIKKKIDSKLEINKIIKKNPGRKLKKRKNSPNLYSPEYLAKKHGINIKDTSSEGGKKSISSKNNVTFGFYNSLIFIIVILVFLSRSLYFFQDIIIVNFPITEFYLDYFFESIRNIFEIINNLFTNY
jgi:predicted Zn finger-like uncharacterized protein|tara:strand:+ start:129 stop:641 length:513 start_codon:yes stop_codon:yes gene_type:complete